VARVLTSPARWRPRYRPGKAPSPGYSRFVGLMRLLLPAIALALAGVVVAWPELYRGREGFRLSFAEIRPQDDGLTMSNARYVGKDSNERPFMITAESAVQDVTDGKRVELRTLQADITLTDGTWVTLSADRGIYRQDTQRLELSGSVNIFSDRGFEFHTERARIDLAAGTAEGDDPVRGQGPFGLLEADGFRMTGMGRSILFPANVRLTIFLGAQG